MTERAPEVGIDSAVEEFRFRIETLLDQGVGKMNEDALYIAERRFGVFDGASSLNGYTDEEGHTGGFLAANIIKETFQDSKSSLVDTAFEANRNIAERMGQAGVDTERTENVWGSTMAVVEIDVSNKKFEWAQIADALILLIKKDGTHELVIKDDYDHDRATMVLWKEMAGRGVVNIREELKDELIELRRKANREYGTVNGDPSMEKFLRKGEESLEGVAHMLLFTDGMIPPKKDPAAHDDFSELVSWYLEGGLARVKEQIRERENSDPHCREYPRYKKSDDIGAVAISFE